VSLSKSSLRALILRKIDDAGYGHLLYERTRIFKTLIVHRLDSKHGLAIVTPEQPDDLWTLRRVISKGDLVRSETSRVIKDNSEYSRPDKERVKVTLTVEVEQVRLDSTLSRIRVSGRIVDVSNEILGKGEFHSLNVSEGHRIAIKKPQGFTKVELKLIENSSAVLGDSYFLVALDGREAGVGLVRGTHLKIFPVVESGATGKMFAESKKSTKGSASAYFQKIADMMKSINSGQEGEEEGVGGEVKSSSTRKVFVMGPGTTKNAFVNFLLQNRTKKQFGDVRAVEGLDVAGEDGIYTAVRSPSLQQVLGETRLVKVSKIIQETMKRISLNDERVALAFKENMIAAKAGAVESLLVSDKIFLGPDDEEKVVELLNTVEEFGGETFLLDSSTDLGEQVNSLGGAIGLLRFSLGAKVSQGS
jgi:protein pelota